MTTTDKPALSRELRPVDLRMRVLVSLAARSLSLGGHDDFNQGQVSARLPGADYMLIKGAVRGFDECCPDDVIVAPIDHRIAAHPMAPPELPLHQAVYSARPDVNAVVHSHAPHTLVFGATDLEMRPVSHDGAYFEHRLPRFTMVTNTILDIETGLGVAEALGDAPAVLLRNHGGVVVGESIKHATVHAHTLERACGLQLIAEQQPGGYHWSPPKDVEAKREYIYADLSVRSYWDYCVSKVKRTWPEARTWS
ncbi:MULTISPECIES: class II aldolase/adducin family protein [unclassified Amycolatopsis]|uniref:class II aldolase/adducin family protein n=1 Tax=unclassified Amycolatopsis TaxID=2618356 RepID=UPI001C69EB64|nr:class II aldolase/adducin family protein [Amycolatopsis sp. DSM 110486]QYN17772.1 class II aldolase/adducin family protein [Amycolatopsis sp. DSM 110486]